MSLLTPSVSLRQADTKRPDVLRRRAWWLIVLGFVLPGSAQLLAGNRKLGRIGIVATIVLLVLVVAAIALWAFARTFLLTIIANNAGLLVVEILLVAYAILWVVLGLDTLRLTKSPRIAGKSKFVVAIVSVISLLAPAGAAIYGASIVDASRGLVSSVFTASGPAVEPVNGQYTFMLLGGDAGADRWGLRPDSITVVSVNAQTGAATMIGVPRNLSNVPFAEDSPMHTPYPDGFNCGTSDCYINAAYTYGEGHPELYPNAEAEGSSPGIEATRDAVEGATGLTMQFYVIIDMQGFDDLIDALGGVNINVTERVPIAIEGGPVEEWIEPGEQTMDGYHALWYARSRAGSSDYARMERQREVQAAVIAQFTPSTLLTKYQELASTGVDLVQTDIPQSMLGSLTNLADKTRTMPITTVELVPDNGVVTGNPDFDLVYQLVQDGLTSAETAGTTPTPTPTP